MIVSEPQPFPTRRDRLRELLDSVLDDESADVSDMARSSFSSEFHFSREIRRFTGEPPAALRRRIMLERAAWRLQGGEGVAAVAADEGWSSPEVFSRAFRRAYGVPPSQAGGDFRLPAPNGLHFHPPQSLWVDSAESGDVGRPPEISQLMLAHDIADTAYLIDKARVLTKEQWCQAISPHQVVLSWDGPEPSVAAVLGNTVWTKEVWLASIEGRDYPPRAATDPAVSEPDSLAAHQRDVARQWTSTVARFSAEGRLGDTVIDALCDPPESFQLVGIVAHVLTYAAHRRGLARSMLAQHGVATEQGDPLEWMRTEHNR